MSRRKPPSDSELARAAEARAEGGNWNAAGERVNRSANTVRKWPLAYPERWAEAVRAAHRRVIDDAAAESVFKLRQLVRSGDDKLCSQAAWRLIYQRLELSKIELRAAALAAPPPPPEVQAIVDFMKGHSREELIQIGIHLLNSRVPQCLAVQPAEADGGS